MANEYRSAITPKSIGSILEALANADPRIASFRFGDIAETDQSSEDIFPLVMYEMLDSRITQDQRQERTEWNVKVYCFVPLRTDLANVEDGFSETHTILSDFVLRFRQESQFKAWGFQWEPNAKLDFVLREGRQNLIGVGADLSFSTPLRLCLTDLIGNGTLPDIGLAYSGSTTPASNFLTCSSLSACTVIQSIQADIESLSAATSSFDCADLYACSAFLALSAQTVSNISDISRLFDEVTELDATTTSIAGDIIRLSADTDSNEAAIASLGEQLGSYLPLVGGTLTGSLTAENVKINSIPTNAIVYQTNSSLSGNTLRMRYDPTSSLTYIDSLSGRSLTISNTISEGGTSLAAKYAPISVVNHFVQGGVNISTGGTLTAPTVNLNSSIALTQVSANVVSASTASASTIYIEAIRQSNTTSVKQTSSYTFSSATYVDIPGMSFPVAANTSYSYHFLVSWSSSNTSAGSAFAINGPAAPQLVSFVLQNHQASGQFVRFGQAFDDGAAGGNVASAGAFYTAVLNGNLTTGAAGGTLSLRGIRGGSAFNLTVYSGSTGTLTKY